MDPADNPCHHDAARRDRPRAHLTSALLLTAWSMSCGAVHQNPPRGGPSASPTTPDVPVGATDAARDANPDAPSLAIDGGPIAQGEGDAGASLPAPSNALCRTLLAAQAPQRGRTLAELLGRGEDAGSPPLTSGVLVAQGGDQSAVVRRDPGFSIARPTRDIICGRVTSIAESTVTVEGDGAAPGGSFGLSVSPATALPFAVGSYLVVRSSTSHVAIHTDPSVLVFEGNGSLLAARLPGSFEVSGLTVERGARGRAEMGGWLRVYGLRVTLYGRLALLPPDTWRRLTTPRGTYLLQGSMTVVETPPPARPGTPSQQRPLDLYGGSLLNILREGVTR